MSDSTVTHLLDRAKAGDNNARDQLFKIVYSELRRIAGRHMRNERPNHTLQPTALVHEAYIQLFDDSEKPWSNRAHFFALASVEMRRLLVDYARRHRAQKRGGGGRQITLTGHLAYTEDTAEDLLALDQALDRLTAIKPQASRVVEMTYFAGMTQAEAAEVLGCSERTVKRQWEFARNFLLDELSGRPA
jgi:RNA polymerase sigma-70 factor, ECF subfamily